MFQHPNHRGARRRGRARNSKLIGKNNEEKLPQSGKGNRLPEVQGAQRVLKKLDPIKHTPRHIMITLPKTKDKERILKAERKGDSYLQRSSHKTIS